MKCSKCKQETDFLWDGMCQNCYVKLHDSSDKESKVSRLKIIYLDLSKETTIADDDFEEYLENLIRMDLEE